MRTFSGWFVGVLAALCMGLALSCVGSSLGVPSSLSLDDPTTVTRGSGRESYEEEVSSVHTSFGVLSGAFAIAFGIWAGQAAYHLKLNAGLSRKGMLSLIAWLAALGILVVLSVVIHLAFVTFTGAIAYYARMLLEFAAIGGVSWALHQWYKNRAANLPVKSDA
jgi:hypothetical protein